MNKLLTLASVALLATPLFAQEDLNKNPGEGVRGPEFTNPEVKTEPSKFTFEGEVNYVTSYFSRGYNYGKDHLFIQPTATLSYEAMKNDPFTLTPYFNVWANITDDQYAHLDYFDELDLTAGLTLEFGRFTVGANYIYYVSPADNFDDLHEIGMSLSFDDSDVNHLPIALNPYVSVFSEVIDRGGPEGAAAELGINPEFTIEKTPLTLSFPMRLGVNVNDFYFDANGGNDPFGYISGGIGAVYNLNDNWYVTGGAHYLNLLAGSTRASNGGDVHQVIGKVGVGFSY